MIFPGSPLARKPPRWVMAAELVETSRLFARTVARINPEWIEPLAGHLVRRSYSEPHWSRKRAAAVATERVTLHGIPIVAGRTVDFGRIDPELSRELFIRHALVEGDWDTRHRFFHANRELLADVEELEHRARRRDLVVDEQALVDFYERLHPGRGGVRAALRQLVEAHLAAAAGRCSTSPRRCCAPRRPTRSTASAYPDHVAAGGLTLPLSYAFEPGQRTDGVTVDVPVAALHQVDPTPFTWQVPGLREELVTALIKTLPKTAAPALRPGPRPRPRRAGHAAGRRRAAAGRAGAGAGPDARRAHPARGLGAGPAARAPHGDLPGARRARHRAGHRHRPGGAAPAAGPAGARRAGGGRRGPGAHRPDHLVDRHAAPRAPDPPRRARGHRLPRAGRPRLAPWTSGWPRPRPSAIRPCGAACAGCCCWTPRRRSGRCSATWTTRPSWPCPATRTARWPRCWTTASPRPPTR